MAEFEWRNFLNVIILVMAILIIILIISQVLRVSTRETLPLTPIMAIGNYLLKT